MSVEQEIKLEVHGATPLDPGSLDWLVALATDTPRQVYMESTYYDTPERALRTFGAGLRLRRVGDRWLQTVKCSGEARDGLHQRKEWEHVLSGPEFDTDRLRETVLAPLVDDATVWPRLVPLFTTAFTRLLLDVELEDGTAVELAYDRGEVRTDFRHVPLHEIELELRAGSLAQLQTLAERLRAVLPLRYSNTSKAEKGYELVQAADKQ